MKYIVTLVFILGSFFAHGAESKSKLVDVDKNSKLSDYFKKINKKVTDDSESKELVSVKKISGTQSKELAEEEILLEEATTKKKKSAEMSPMNKMVIAIFAFLLMAGVVFASLKKMGVKKGHTSIAKNIKILTQKSIGPKKNLMLIRVAGETILLGVTDQNINHIKTLSLMEDEIPSFTEPKFSSQLKDKIEQTKAEPSLIEKQPEEVDGFSISSLNDVKKAASRYTI